MNIFKSESENKTGKILFYIFEAAAAFVALVTFILAIIYADSYQAFIVFVEYFVNGIVSSLTIFGFGKIIDLLYARKSKCEKKNVEAEKKNVEVEDTETKDAE